MTIDIERLKTDLDYWLSMAPEGATHYCIEQPCPWLREEPLSYFRLDQWVDYGTPKMGMEHIANAIPRPSPAWDGSGLPPVGVECEFLWGGVSQGVVEIIQYRRSKAIFWRKEKDHVDSAELPTAAFRPLKTEKERVVEAAAQVAGYGKDATIVPIVIGRLYDAGMLKEPTND